MTSLLNRYSFLALLPASLLFTSCGSNAVYVDSGGPNTIVTLDSINIQDWSRAADEMVESLLGSNALDNAPRKPAVMALSRIVNNTTLSIDTDMLTTKIRERLLQSGKVVTSTTIGLGGKAQDPLAKEMKDYERFQSGDRSPSKTDMPDYTLSGKILEDKVSAGRTKQTTYIFQLSLTNVRSGTEVWVAERQITKQGTRSSVGW